MQELASHPKLLHSLCMLAAMVVAFALYRHNRSALPLSKDHQRFIAVAACLGALIGSKLPFLIDRDWQGLSPWTSWLTDGKTVLGGLLVGYLAVEATKWYLGIRIRTGDAFAVPIAAALCIGRIGCFFGGCCYGLPTELPWGVCFHAADGEHLLPRHPTQLYESLFHGLCLVLLVAISTKSIASNQEAHRLLGSLQGHHLKLYLLAYLAFRFMTEWIRPEPIFAWHMTAYQIACILFAVLLGLQWRFQRSS